METRNGSGDGSLVAFVSTAVTLAVLGTAFAAFALGVPWFWVAFPIGFGGLLPLSITATRRWEGRRQPSAEGTTDPQETALATLRERYARDEIDEEEFENRVERLLETESVSRAADYVDREEPIRE